MNITDKQKDMLNSNYNPCYHGTYLLYEAGRSSRNFFALKHIASLGPLELYIPESGNVFYVYYKCKLNLITGGTYYFQVTDCFSDWREKQKNQFVDQYHELENFKHHAETTYQRIIENWGNSLK